MLHAVYSGGMTIPTLRCGPYPIGMTYPQLIGKKAKELAGFAVQAGWQRQQVVNGRHLDQRLGRVGHLRCHDLHRVQAGAVIAVIFSNEADGLRIDR